MRLLLLLSIAISLGVFTVRGEDWPQFRGPGGRAVSESATPPIGFGPSSNLLWKVAIPEGVSSPIVTGDRIFLTAPTAKKTETFPLSGELNFLTADTGNKIETIALDRRDGRILWKRGLGSEGTPTPTPVTDGKSVYVYFGSIGVIAYSLDGQELWRHPIAKPDFSASSSPILIDDKFIIVCDRETDSFVEALDKKTGRSLWRAERPQFRRARATPFHWKHGHEEELIVSGSFALTSYDPNTGAQKWRFPGAARWAMSSPAVGENLIFALTMKDGFGETPDEDGVPTIGIPTYDLTQLTGTEPPKAASALRAIRPGGCTVVVWNSVRSLPYGNSPLYYQGRLFTVKSGGFVTAYNAKTGESIYRDERINAPDDYWSSPIAAAGRVYFASEKGIVTVMDATADKPTILAQNKLDEQILATPALIDQTILIRTAKNLYSFGTSK
ncbi:MAG TPA: PQQ-binding-like beta-propeller repeat protein [Candidatus Limnocylindria bacterium]|nr:PQQ-binding-like beta-propeller repeat protein [Candidatus Limnocylindria bacterium]